MSSSMRVVPEATHEALVGFIAKRNAHDQHELVTETRNMLGWSLRFDVVYTHAPCTDGRFAAWVAIKYNPHAYVCGIEPMANTYASDDVRARHVLVLDQCFSTDALERMVREAARVCVIDHHASSKPVLLAVLERLAGEPEQQAKLSYVLATNERLSCCELLHWTLSPTAPLPWFLAYAGDADMQRYALPLSREINAALYQHKYTGVMSDSHVFDWKFPRKISDPQPCWEPLAELEQHRFASDIVCRCLELAEEGRSLLADAQQSVEKLVGSSALFRLTAATVSEHAALRIRHVACPVLAWIPSLVDRLAQLEGDVVLVSLADKCHGQVKLSFRRSHTRPDLNLHLLAKHEFGGGGRPSAAGATLNAEQFSNALATLEANAS